MQMSLFGRNDQSVSANSSTTHESTNGAPIGTWTAVKGDQLNRVDGANAHFGNTSPGTRANTDVEMFQNDTPGAFMNGIAVGVFGVTAVEMANNTVNHSQDNPAHAGWVLRRAGTGPVVAVAITPASGDVGFISGETITVSNGSANATITAMSNSQGNLAAVVLNNGGAGWTNTAMAEITFNREKYVSSVTVLNANAGYDNTSIVTFSNGTVNAVSANISTNATGGFTTLTLVSNGLFPHALVAGQVKMTVTKNDGTAAVGNSSVVALTPVLANSSGGAITLTLGGRANRVQTETLVAMGSLGNTDAKYGTAVVTTGANANNTHYPE
jgi:hypothetical protein